MTSALAPVSWAPPVSRGTSAGAVAAAVIFLVAGFVIAALGFAMPMAVRLIDARGISAPAPDMTLVRSMAADGGFIVVVGLLHAIVGVGVLAGRRIARRAATVLAGSGIVVGVVGFLAAEAAWGPFAGTALARPGSPRMDGLGITLALVLVEAIVLLAVRSAERFARAEG